MDPMIRQLMELLGITEEEAQALVDEGATAVDARLVEAGQAIDTTDPSDEDLERLDALQAVAQEVRALAELHEAEVAERRARAEAARTALVGETDEADGEGEEAAEGAPAEGEPPAADAPPAEGEPPAEPAPDHTQPVDAGTPPAPVAEDRQPEPVAASARPPLLRRLSPVARRTPAANAPTNTGSPVRLRRGRVSLTAAAGVPGHNAGDDFRSLDDVAESMLETWQRLVNSRGHGADGDQVSVARLAAAYPEDRIIDTDDPARVEEVFENTAPLPSSIEEYRALTAAGGFCAPTTPLYDLVTVSTADRPVRDALPGYQATRGGIRFAPPPKVSDLSGAVSTWTAATDAAPGGSTKACLTVTCATITEVLLDAIPACLQFGNFQARAFPEQVARFQQLAIAWQARYAERKLLTQMGALSIPISTGQTLGAVRDFFAEAQRIDAAYRQRHRTGPDAPLRAILPFHLRQRMRADLIRELPGDNAVAMADEIIDAAIEDLRWNVSWALDGETGQEFAPQGGVAGGANAGAVPWPATAVWYLFHEGAFVFLDGGTLDLGIVRDSTLNAKNNFQVFSETFEQVALRGVEALRVTSTLCPSGGTAATVSTSGLCTSGS